MQILTSAHSTSSMKKRNWDKIYAPMLYLKNIWLQIYKSIFSIVKIFLTSFSSRLLDRSKLLLALNYCWIKMNPSAKTNAQTDRLTAFYSNKRKLTHTISCCNLTNLLFNSKPQVRDKVWSWKWIYNFQDWSSSSWPGTLIKYSSLIQSVV